MSRMSRLIPASALAALALRGAAATCPSGLDPYMAEASPFGWPLAPNEWQYAHPECWAEKYPLCAGERQSPMDIDFSSTTADCLPKNADSAAGALSQKASYKILAGTPEVSVSKYMRSAVLSGELGSVKLMGASGVEVEYEAVQAHLTAGSLHSINGSLADAELMVLHKPKGAVDALSNAVVISVLFREGQASSALFSQMGFSNEGDSYSHETGPTWNAPESVDLQAAMFTAMQGVSYSYSGSVPVPPCSESAHYIVLASQQSVGANQVAKLKDMLSKQTGGTQKRPPVARKVGGICREIEQNSLRVSEPHTGCAEASDKSAACWATTCDKSPVDIKTSMATALGNTKLDKLMMYKPTNHAIVSPSEYTLDARGSFGQLMLNGRVFVAKKLSIKAMAQHTIDGERFAGELVIEHVLFGDSFDVDAGHGDQHHRRMETETEAHADGHGEAGHSSEEHRVMVSVPLKLGRENALLRSLGFDIEAHKEAIRHGNAYEVDSTIDLGGALAMEQPWYWYSGGPTTPGSCPAWGVKWVVLTQPLEVSLAQLNTLTLPVSGVDSTVMTKTIAASSIMQSSVPEDGISLGSCAHTDDMHNDPSCWGAASPICRSGEAQSPINIETAAISKVGSESFLAKASWKPISGLRLTNNGNYLGFETTQMGYATIIGSNGFPKFYQVTSVAIRMPSEHLIDGKQYPAELQITHKNQKTVLELEDDDAIITSVMFDFGEESKLLKQLLPEKLPAAGSYVAIEKPVDLQWALGPAIDGPFFKYDGSYTTPGCAEAVSWAVFETPMTLSKEQWQAFKALFPNPGNNRPVQPLLSRTIAKNTMEEAEAVDYKFFLNREMGRDKRETNPALIAFPIIGTLLLCSTIMTAVFQREDPKRKAESAGGLQATTIGRGYNQF